MQNKINVDITGVQATMLIPLRGRAIMSDRFPDLYQNQNDIDIVHKLNFDFSAIDQALGEYGNLCYIARALATEKAIKQFIGNYPEATIVNIGAGLDTTFPRVDNDLITWYDLDLPDSMQFRNLVIEPSGRAHCIAKSVFDLSWLDDIDYDESKGLLLIAAGVFHFLPETELKELFITLAKRCRNTELFFDINSVLGNEYAAQSIKASGSNALPCFGVDDGTALEQWSDQIRLMECLPYFGDIPRYPELAETTITYMNMADSQGICKFLHYQLGN